MSLLILMAGSSSSGGGGSTTPSRSLMLWGCGNVLAAFALGTAMILAAL